MVDCRGTQDGCESDSERETAGLAAVNPGVLDRCEHVSIKLELR